MSPSGRPSPVASAAEVMAARVFEKQMGITHPEFFRLIAVALGAEDYAREPDGVSWDRDGRSGRIRLGPEGKRQIALLAVPSTAVSIELVGYGEAEAEAFMVQFDRAYQRGGS